MTAEEFYINFLSNALELPVSGDIPSPIPDRFVTLEQIGSRTENQLYHPTIAVQSWGESRNVAADINELVKATMAKSAGEPEISQCKLSSDYNFPELETKRPRYQAIFNITYLGG